MPYQQDLYLLINDYLDHSTRRALTQVSPALDLIHQKWCTRRVQYLLQKCPLLSYLGFHKLLTMLRSGVAITFDPILPSLYEIDCIFTRYEIAIDDDEYTRIRLEATLLDLVIHRGKRFIPNCQPLFICDSGIALVTLDEELNLYMNEKKVLNGVISIDFHTGHPDSYILTERGEVYESDGEDEVRRICNTGFVNHISGMYHIRDNYYLCDEESINDKVSDDPVVLLREGNSPSTCLITCANSTNRTSFILGINEGEIIFRFSIPPVRMAIEISIGYLVLLDEGPCAILRQNIYDKQIFDVIIRDSTYDYIGRCDRDNIVARRGEKIYLLEIQGDVVEEEETDDFFPVSGYNGNYRLSY
jgi:hypothetical protein